MSNYNGDAKAPPLVVGSSICHEPSYFTGSLQTCLASSKSQKKKEEQCSKNIHSISLVFFFFFRNSRSVCLESERPDFSYVKFEMELL